MISKRSQFGKPVSGAHWIGCSAVEERCQHLENPWDLKAFVELVHVYLGDNKRNSNQRKHVISSRAVKRARPPRKR